MRRKIKSKPKTKIRRVVKVVRVKNIVDHQKLDRETPKRRAGLRISPDYVLGNCELVWHDGSFLLLHKPSARDALATDKKDKVGHFMHNGRGKPEFVHCHNSVMTFQYRIWNVRASFSNGGMTVIIYRNDEHLTPYDGAIVVAYEKPDKNLQRNSVPIELRGNENAK